MRARRTLVAALVLCAACSSRGEDREPSPDEVACTMEARSAFAVTVLDASTGARVIGATVRITDGSFSENLAEYDGVFSGAHERSGTFTVVVSAPDYQQWQRAGVTVERDECHVITEEVEARLIRDDTQGDER